MLIWEHMAQRNHEDLQMLADLKHFNESEMFHQIDVLGCYGS